MNQTEAKRRQAESLSNILMLITIYIMGRLTGDKGITYMAVAAYTGALLWAVADGSLSDALGRLLRSRKNKGQYRNIVKMRSSALIFQAALGFLGSLLLFLLANVAAEKVFHVPHSWLIFLALCPAIFLRTVSGVLLGFFQGEGSELPRAVSSILRPVFLLGFGVLFVHLVGGYGEKVSGLLRQADFQAMYGGVGIALAACLTEVLVLLFLGLIYKGRREDKKARQDGFPTESTWDCIRYLCAGRWPQCASVFLLVLPFALGLLFVGRTAEDGSQMALDYGAYGGKYLVVCGIGTALITLAGLSVISRIFRCFKREENRFARTVFQSGVHICLVHGIFLSVFTAVMGMQIADMLCAENSEKIAGMLHVGSFLIVLGALSGYFCRLLHSLGKRYPVLLAVCGGDIVFLIVVAPSAGKIGVLSLVYGGVAEALALCVLSGMFVYRQLRVRPDWLGTFVMPLGAGGVAGLICLLVNRLCASHLGSLATVLIAFIAAGAVYWILLVLLRNFREQELETIPGGKLVGLLAQLLRIRI